MKNLVKLVVDEGNSSEVADSFGIESIRRNGKTFIRCPSHLKTLGRADRNIGQCVLTEKGYYCFSCGSKGDFVRMIADFLGKPYETNVEKNEVAKLVIQEVYPELGIDIDTGSDSAPVHRLPYKADVLKSIGLHTMVDCKVYDRPYQYGEDLGYNETKEIFDYETGEYYVSKNHPYSLAEFYSDDPESCMYMIINKAQETYDMCKNIFDQYLNNPEAIASKLGIEVTSVKRLLPGFRETMRTCLENSYFILSTQGIVREKKLESPHSILKRMFERRSAAR